MELFTFTPEIYVLLFVVATVAGFIDAIAGGGGLIVMPILLAVGIQPTQVLGTNKLQSMGGAFSASLYFVRRRVVNLKEQRLPIFLAFIGSILGAIVIQQVDASFLRMMLPALIISVGLYFILTPGVGKTDGHRRLTMLPFAMAMGCVGFYDGFFGPGTGSFYALGYVLLYGLNLATATAHAKVLNFTSNISALVFFIIGGNVLWDVGLIMLVGQIIGARFGANMVLSKGQKLIRPMIIIMSLIMSSKLMYDNFSDTLIHWFS